MSGVGYFHWIDTDMVRGADAHPAMENFRAQTSGPLGKTYSVASVGKAVVEGMEQRRKWVVVPGWVRGLLLLRGVLGPAIHRGAKDAVPEADAAFERDIAERGVEAVSAPSASAVRRTRSSASGRPTEPSPTS